MFAFLLSARRNRLAVGAALTLVLALVATPALAVFVSRVRVVDPRSGEPGQHTDGSIQLINQRTVTPAGQQSPAGDYPINAILSPDGRHLLVSNSGAGIQSLQVVDTHTGQVIQSIPYLVPDSVFFGLAYSPDGSHVYASGGGNNVIHTYSVGGDGKLTAGPDLSAGQSQSKPLGTAPWPIGLSLTPDGSTLFVASNLSNAVSVIDAHTGILKATIPVGTYPFTTLMTPDGAHVYVSNWGDATVSVIDAGTRNVISTIRVGNHPSALLSDGGDKIYVADSNSETQRISLAPYHNAQLSSSPEGLALSPDHKTLYVADSGGNEISVVSLGGSDKADIGKVVGRIPTAWYPSSVTVSHDGKTLWVTNAKGIGAGPNSTGLNPNPTRRNPPIVDGVTGYNDGYCSCTFDNYTGSMIEGTLSSIPVPGKGRLAVYTAQVARNNRYPSSGGGDEDTANAQADDSANLGALRSERSPIKHAIYIIKENRTFDQVFGDAPLGDRDPALTLFPRTNTPNLHALIERFGILDNFYADAEVSADGHNWATSANASDYNEKMWPEDYSPAVGRNRAYDFEGATTINLSPGGYIWDAVAAAHITYRDYGEFSNNGSAAKATLIPASQASTCAGPVAHAYLGVTIPAGQVLCFPPTTVNATTVPNLVGHVDPNFRGYDLRYREADRVAEWKREFDQYSANGDLPQLEIMRLPNDHTAGTTPGALTPQAFVAENDLAVGQVVEIVSHSPFWSSTAIFITEDDAQNGPDHVDAHRTTSLVVSPFTSREDARVDHTLYDTSAMLRTIEVILGLQPLSQYDANSAPIARLFDDDVNDDALAPYDALPESIAPTTFNTANSFGADESAAMDFS